MRGQLDFLMLRRHVNLMLTIDHGEILKIWPSFNIYIIRSAVILSQSPSMPQNQIKWMVVWIDGRLPLSKGDAAEDGAH
jgi:hypothetical protein